ncbi:MAG: acetyl-CoA carboxylase, carboxyltransferase subunit beta [Candidatus Kapaibacteriales bacterium]
MAWFKREKKNIDSKDSKSMPEGLWTKCPDCGTVIYKKELDENLYTCPECDHHFRITTDEYVELLIDAGTWEETNSEVRSSDPLKFTDTKPYSERLEVAYAKTGLPDALTTGLGKIDKQMVSLASMNFKFVGGSMGSVVGEKFVRGVDSAIENSCPFIIISASGGARMQEAALSLMQMAKTSIALQELAEHKLPYISILTDPTTGGVSASFAMLGDINIAEPKALIGFAGPRVIEQTIKKKLPEGFQRSEFLLEHGFLDKIVHRKNMKEFVSNYISWAMSN